jgi:hypothetical protein
MRRLACGTAFGYTRIVAGILLLAHGGVLAWSAYRYSPTLDEPALFRPLRIRGSDSG